MNWWKRIDNLTWRFRRFLRRHWRKSHARGVEMTEREKHGPACGVEMMEEGTVIPLHSQVIPNAPSPTSSRTRSGGILIPSRHSERAAEESQMAWPVRDFSAAPGTTVPVRGVEMTEREKHGPARGAEMTMMEVRHIHSLFYLPLRTIILTFATHWFKTYHPGMFWLKGNQVQILDRPATVSSIATLWHYLATVAFTTATGRPLKVGISQETCQAVFILSFRGMKLWIQMHVW